MMIRYSSLQGTVRFSSARLPPSSQTITAPPSLFLFFLLPHRSSFPPTRFESRAAILLQLTTNPKSLLFLWDVTKMQPFKQKLGDRFSRLFTDDSTSPSQARSSSRGGSFYSSFLSYINPSGGPKSSDHYNDLKPLQSLPVRWTNKRHLLPDQPLDVYKESSSACESEDVKSYTTEDQRSSQIHVDGQGGRVNGDVQNCGFARIDSVPNDYEEARDHGLDRPLHCLTDDSIFITNVLFEFLQCSLPNIVRGCRWALLYSTLKHGISLRTLIRKSAELSGPCLLIAGDMKGAVFGAMLECPLKPTPKRKYQGSNQTFVFTTLYGEPRMFRPTGANRYYYICLTDLLALGGGSNFALSFDGDLLHGSSGPCETFGNLCLAHDPEFEIKNLELWGFTHG